VCRIAIVGVRVVKFRMRKRRDQARNTGGVVIFPMTAMAQRRAADVT